MSPAIGQPAPGFDLPASTGKNISLASLRGSKVVLQFFPFAFTGICTGELCDLPQRNERDGQIDDALRHHRAVRQLPLDGRLDTDPLYAFKPRFPGHAQGRRDLCELPYDKFADGDLAERGLQA